jgi:aminoglycoside phosphotransferase (APT) family kinase protein
VSDESRAREAGVGVARDFGLRGAPTLLQRSRHLFLLIRDDGLVIRVTPQRDDVETIAKREIAVLNHLSVKGAPVVGPRQDLPMGPHLRAGFVVTFWPFIAHGEADYDDEQALSRSAEALREVHAAMADFGSPLPSYLDRIDHCGVVLADPLRLQGLAREDRRLVEDIYEETRRRLATYQTRDVPIHGDAHLGNVFMTAEGPLWTDFETVCLGPREWDVCGAPYPAAFEPIDRALYRLLTFLRSVCVVTWCMDLAGMPEKRAAGEDQLARLKDQWLRRRAVEAL